MLERIREGSQGLGAKIILGLVIITFALAGVGSYLNATSDQPVATVNGDEIGQSSLERAYQNERARMEQQYGDAFTDMMADSEYMRSFRRNLLDRLIADKLVEQAAEELGLRVSDQQVKQAILDTPSFQIAGVFNNDRYQAILRQNALQPKDFRDTLRRDLTRQQVVTAVLGSEFSLDSESQQAYRLQQQTRDLGYLSIPASAFGQEVDVSDEEINAFYQANIASFDTQEKVSLRYVELEVEDLLSDAEVSETELEEYYQLNAEQYRSEEERRASHILLEVDDDNAEEQMALAQELRQRLQDGEDFAALAEEYSDDTFSAENGGDLDWFGREVMDPDFEEATFALQQEGDISEPVTTEFGIHLIKLTGIKPEQVQSLEELRDEITAQVKRDKAVAEFYDLHEQIARVAFEMPDNLDEVAQLAGQPVQSTSLFSRTDAPELFSSNQMMNAAFSAELIEDRVNSDVIDVSSEHLVVMRVGEHQPQRTRALDEVEPMIYEQLQAQKAQQAARDWAKEILGDYQSGETDAAEEKLAQMSLSWEEYEAQMRYGASLPPAVIEEAFRLSAQQNDNMAVVNTNDGNVALVRVDQIHTADDAEPAMLGQLSEQLSEGRGQRVYMDFIEALKEDADIEVYAVQPEPAQY
ncbi:SurA N-terminal domain-containing protein [Lacimicrobium alkaliphilum]|uniref:Periplasmic chaperone PpiD n=1 Tax=Lacimicrobium alkaliphilum TaxID=1526571 RepID=A0A0U2QKP0_9ALTE|nr:SurA N-terminal domain-containing protein [Lacimicrobium alkaliphilum]ALS97819.1 peptidylprolyl isomerase [Lacimicrobium alkaliphilum]